MPLFDPKDLARYPTKSGVYLMKNAKNQVLYVGKAKNLRTRIRQYFAKSGDERAMVPHLIKNTHTIAIIVVPTERDALLLENTLIKKHQPKYNALLKDDKRYVNIVLTNKHPWPRLIMQRHKKKSHDMRNTFGPYTNAKVAREVLDLMNRIFALRECSDQEMIRRTRPCILHGIKRCAAPCVELCTKESYQEIVESVRKLLQGKDQTILQTLKKHMQTAAEQHLFEKAASIRDMIRKIEHILSKQHVDNSAAKNCDVLALYRQADYAVVAKLLFRDHKLIGAEHFSFTAVLSNNQEILETFLLQHYEKQETPKEIFLPEKLENIATLQDILSTKAATKIYISTPQKGEKKALIEMAQENALVMWKKEKDVNAARESTLLQMQEALQLEDFPRKIVCFDSSSIQGAFCVAAAVVFINGKKQKEEQRYFSIDNKGEMDDYKSLQEAIERYLKKVQDPPDVLLIDGGKGHVHMATKVVEKQNLAGIEVLGIAKESSLHTKALTKETIHRQYKDPIHLPRHSPVLFLLQKIRDEAHDVVLAFHRKKRTKKTIRSSLEKVPGIGPKKRTLLLKKYGSIAQLSKALKENYKEDVAGITKKDWKNLQTFFVKEGAS